MAHVIGLRLSFHGCWGKRQKWAEYDHYCGWRKKASASAVIARRDSSLK
jgi:hypothetical protein